MVLISLENKYLLTDPASRTRITVYYAEAGCKAKGVGLTWIPTVGSVTALL